MPFSRILNRVLSYTEYGPEYHADNQKVIKRLVAINKTKQNYKTSLCLWYSNESNAEQYYLNLLNIGVITLPHTPIDNEPIYLYISKIRYHNTY
jgi:hypothetical protein